MITYVKRKNLEVDKYNACIKNSIQSRIYAFSWYLDIVADNWIVLVLNDYQAVMPIPWKKKYFIKHIAQPLFCQQLGVFSREIITQELQQKMLKNIPKKFVKISLNFNSDNFLMLKSTPKKNYILELNKPFNLLFKSFSKGRKHAVKVGEKSNLILKNITIFELIKLKKEFYNHIIFSEKLIAELSDSVLNNNKGFILGVFKNDVLLGGGFFLLSNNRITYLFSSFSTQGRKLQAASFLINSIINKYENSNFILDFEGGNLPNIGSFFKSFGAKNQQYYHINHTSLSTFFRY
jgi:hypothetical protein